ncbi:MAG: choice-of-anchor E domain-containing protein [Planctomycetes bacterium]|nr:choice-of-anchor E domain-containing protein [Planctomycetota bacterium]
MRPARPLSAALAAALLLPGAPPASAGLGPLHRPSALPWADTVQLRTFDARHGQLLAAHLVITAHARTRISVENTSDTPQLVQAGSTTRVRVLLPSGQTLATVPFDAGDQWVLAPYDGVLDFAGSSGRSADHSARSRAEVVITDPALLLYFLSPPGGGGRVELPAAAIGFADVLGGDGLSREVSLEAGLRVRVDYVFAPWS